MRRVIVLAVVALILCWQSLATAQVWSDPHVNKEGVPVQRTNGAPWAGIPKTVWVYPAGTNPYAGKELPGERARNFWQYEGRNPVGSDGYNQSPYPYQYNPYQFRW
jgi:hypothetical protein